MSHWNYRLVRRRDGLFSVHEVHYNNDGEAYAMTANPVSIGPFETSVEITEMLMTVRTDVRVRPVFVEPKKWAQRSDDRTVAHGKKLKPRLPRSGASRGEGKP